MAAPTLDTDWLAPGALIVERLRAEVPALRLVAAIDELNDLDARAKQTPAAFVAYDGDRLAEATPSGCSEAGAQRWLVVLAVRNARAGGDNAGLPQHAGPLLPQIANALRGWAPGDAGRGLRRASGPRPGYSTAFAYYPLAFELPFVTATPRR